MEKIKRFIVPDSLNPNTFLSHLKNQYKSRKQPRFFEEPVFYDTFDWRLFDKNLSLLSQEKSFILYNLKTENQIASVIYDNKIPPGFWWDFPDGAMGQLLKPILGVRALLNLGWIKKRILPVQILNIDEKIVVRIKIESVIPFASSKKIEHANQVIVEAVKGYQKPFKDICAFLSSNGLEQSGSPNFNLILESLGKKPGEYSSKLSLQLQKDMPAREATIVILKHLLWIIKQNETGTKEDIDTEFLHDFRVAVRRTRSALEQIKGVFPTEVVNQYRSDFAKIGKSTNQLRDLDVYILKREKYEQMLPMHLREGLNPLFAELARQRKLNHRNITKVLDSDFYKTALISFETFLSSTDETDGNSATNAAMPIINLSKRFIFRRYKRILKDGQKINNTTPDHYLHQLRIECKKLRYLLEFFFSLFPQKKISTLIKYIKILQDNLGSFNDFSIQQNMLEDYLAGLKQNTKNLILIAAAVGGLITELHREQQAARKAFSKTFTEFSCEQSRDLFQELFG
jgi:CHAD domain-containing protein